MSTETADMQPTKQSKDSYGVNGNLTRAHGWGKGISGNPAGRPKQEPLLTPELRKQLGSVCQTDPQKRIWCVVLIERLMEHAAKGNPAAIKELWERMEGKVKENVQVDVNVLVGKMSDDELEAAVRGAINITPEPGRLES
jgi:hypothetical protein